MTIKARRVKQNEIAWAVKIADTKANLKQSVLDNDKNRIVKYAKQLMLLEERGKLTNVQTLLLLKNEETL